MRQAGRIIAGSMDDGPRDVPDLVPARMINEVLYCERLMYLEWAQGEFVDNAFTVEGRAVHRRADKAGGKLAPATDETAPDDDATGAPQVARSVWLSSTELGITAKIDIVESDDRGVAIPLDYKRGKRPSVPDGAYLPERAQVCAQVLLLRDHGYTAEHGLLYFAGDKQRVTVVIDEALIAATRGAADRARALAAGRTLPPPLIDSPKCRGCSLAPVCLPDEVAWLREETGVATDTGQTLVSAADEPRRLYAARDDKLPLYVQEHGARIGLEGDCLIVRSRKHDPVRVRIPNTSQVSVLGNAQLTTQALCALMRRQIPVSFFTGGGWYIGRASGFSSNNVELRVAQYAAARDPDRCVALARALVESKIRNSRTLLRRNGRGDDEVTLGSLKRHARSSAGACSLAELLGIEGSAARHYFAAFSGMFKAAGGPDGFSLEGRNRRPPRDPVNAMLSFLYALLTKDMANAIAVVGLDPLLGFYHQPRFGRPALALDLMEEFRPIIADSVVVSTINNGIVTVKDFDQSPVGVSIRPAARRRVIAAYERRMDQLVTHPVFGYRLSYRRVLEVQARLLARVLLGEIDSYPTFQTR